MFSRFSSKRYFVTKKSGNDLHTGHTKHQLGNCALKHLLRTFCYLPEESRACSPSGAMRREKRRSWSAIKKGGEDREKSQDSQGTEYKSGKRPAGISVQKGGGRNCTGRPSAVASAAAVLSGLNELRRSLELGNGGKNPRFFLHKVHIAHESCC